MHGHHHQGVGKNSNHDRGHAVQQIRGVPHNKGDGPSAEFRQVDPSEQSDGNPEEGRKQEKLQAAHDRIGHASARFTDRGGQMREEAPRQIFSAVVHEIAENEKQDRHGNQYTYAREREHRHVQRFSPHQPDVHVGNTPLPRAVVTRIRSRASPFSTNVKRKSTRPSSIRALKYKFPVASENSLASTAAIEYPGENRDAAILGLLPMTMVTAMVSPSARASARNTEPKMPILAAGTTTFQVDSHLVAPRASAASRWSRGIASRTSRDTESTNGTIMMARTIPAVRKPIPYAGPLNRGRYPSVFFSAG